MTFWFLPKNIFLGLQISEVLWKSTLENLEEGHDRLTILFLDFCIHYYMKPSKCTCWQKPWRPSYVCAHLCQQLISAWTVCFIFTRGSFVLISNFLLLKLFTIPKYNIIFKSPMLILHLSTSSAWKWNRGINFASSQQFFHFISWLSQCAGPTSGKLLIIENLLVIL